MEYPLRRTTGKLAAVEALVEGNTDSLIHLVKVYFVNERKVLRPEKSNTFKTYVTGISSYVAWWKESVGPIKVEFDKESIDAFYNHCLAQGLNPSSIRVRLAALSCLAEALTFHGYPVKIPVIRRAPAETGPKVYPFHWDTFVRAFSEVKNSRTKAMVALGGFMGLRCSEMANLKWSDVQSDCLIIHGKGKKIRVVPLNRRAKEALNSWADKSTGEYVFESRSGGPLDRSLIWRAISRWEKKLNLPTGVHILRTTFATQVYNQKGDLGLVQDLLGHKNISTTRNYARVAVDRMKSAVVNL